MPELGEGGSLERQRLDVTEFHFVFARYSQRCSILRKCQIVQILASEAPAPGGIIHRDQLHYAVSRCIRAADGDEALRWTEIPPLEISCHIRGQLPAAEFLPGGNVPNLDHVF